MNSRIRTALPRAASPTPITTREIFGVTSSDFWSKGIQVIPGRTVILTGFNLLNGDILRVYRQAPNAPLQRTPVRSDGSFFDITNDDNVLDLSSAGSGTYNLRVESSGSLGRVVVTLEEFDQ